MSVIDDGDGVIVGNPQSGVFVALPPVGGVVIRALQSGASLAEATTEAGRFAGRPVDVAGFVDRLVRLGVLAYPGTDEAELRPRRTAAIQQRRWLAGPAPHQVGWLFGRLAWAVYGALFAFDVVVLTVRPQLMPQARAVYQLWHAGVGPSLVLLFPFVTALVAAHEAGHWLAARAAGVKARFGIDHRMYFLVFEIDLSQLWSLPRRRRFGPLLAGLAVDATVLALLLTIELGVVQHWWLPPPFAIRLVAALAFTEIAAMTWQCLLFLRTDLYAVLVAATGCHNLWRVKTLSLRRALKMLPSAQAADLAGASPRDRAVAAWFRWLWLTGFVAASGWFAWFYLPILTHLIIWIGPGFATSPATARFWTTVGCVAILAWRYGTPAAITVHTAVRAVRRHHAARPNATPQPDSPTASP